MFYNPHSSEWGFCLMVDVALGFTHTGPNFPFSPVLLVWVTIFQNLFTRRYLGLNVAFSLAYAAD